MTNKRTKAAVAKNFVAWYSENVRPIRESAVEQWVAETMIDCDQACAHGPGHQSISECVETTPGHTYHYDDYGHEWGDDKLSKQTYDKRGAGTWYPPLNSPFAGKREYVKGPVLKTYRLYFGDY